MTATLAGGEPVVVPAQWSMAEVEPSPEMLGDVRLHCPGDAWGLAPLAILLSHPGR